MKLNEKQRKSIFLCFSEMASDLIQLKVRKKNSNDIGSQCLWHTAFVGREQGRGKV